MDTVTINQAEEILDLAYTARDQIVICLIGPVGCGKTEAIYRHAAKHNAKVVEIIASQILPNEVSGITMPVDKTHSMEVYDHVRLSSLKDGDILFFDELLEADESVLKACLTLIQERRLMSGKKLPDIQIIAACNPPLSTSMIKPSIKQRFMWLNVDYDFEGLHKIIRERYDVDIAPGRLKKMSSTRKEDQVTTMNFVTPRSICKCIDWILRSEPVNRPEVIRSIGAIFGSSFQEELITFVNPELDALSELNKTLFVNFRKKFDNLEDAIEFIQNIEDEEDKEKILTILKEKTGAWAPC